MSDTWLSAEELEQLKAQARAATRQLLQQTLDMLATLPPLSLPPALTAEEWAATLAELSEPLPLPPALTAEEWAEELEQLRMLTI